jgi:hypothetical protein
VEQRVYHGAITPNELAEFLIQKYDPQPDLQAQLIGQGDALAVQVGRGDVPEKLRHAVTVGITRSDESEQGVVVTLGQQQWITPQMATYAAMIGLVSLLVTPWALFALLWPVSEMVGNTSIPADIWNNVETFALSRGATLVRTEQLTHPHT